MNQPAGNNTFFYRFRGKARRLLLYVLAWLWRQCLVRTTFIAITGSVGKTVCKEMLADILASRYPTARTVYNQNDASGVPKSLLRVRPWHRYAVIEVGAGKPGLIRYSARLVKPQVAIFLGVALTHTDVFDSKEAIYKEKVMLLERLSHAGTAVLNKDDPLVVHARSACKGKIHWFGKDPGADVRVLSMDATWPSRLTLDVQEGKNRVMVKTQLVGSHWRPSVLGAISASRLCGFTMADAAAVISSIVPFMGRMQPVQHPSGAILLRDENNGYMDTVKPALDVLRAARAKRKIFLTSGTAYYPLNNRLRFRKLGAMAAEAADGVIFINKHFGKHGVKAALAAGMDSTSAWWFASLKSASDFLSETLRAGDLVLVKGRSTDHLTRLVYAQFGSVNCWKKQCRKTILCDVCSELKATTPLSNAHPSIQANG